MAHIVKCRWCGIQFDTDILDVNKWVSPSNRVYYHKDCYDEKLKPGSVKPTTKENEQNEFQTWRDNIFDLIQRDLKGSCDFARITQMMTNYKIQHKDWTYKGMYYALRWFYIIKKNDWSKSNGAIGILPYIYYEGTEYWRQKEKENRGIVQSIEEQITKIKNIPIIEISHSKKKKKRGVKTLTFDEIAAMEDEE
jgi:hypothetical protein